MQTKLQMTAYERQARIAKVVKQLTDEEAKEALLKVSKSKRWIVSLVVNFLYTLQKVKSIFIRLAANVPAVIYDNKNDGIF